ncbi:MAG: zinc ribbon domain-containing protein [Bacteroidales bacterium]|nr:zinc ribbon domain-containing protein [Bacteroidales bacterium]
MFCQHCGKEIHDDAVICIHCGCLVKPARHSNASLPERIPHPKENAALAYSIVGFILCWIPIIGFIIPLIGLKLVRTISDDVGLVNEPDSLQASRIFAMIGIVGGVICTLTILAILIAF